MRIEIPEIDPVEEEDVARIMACLDVLEDYDADEPCECRAFGCPRANLNRAYQDLRAFALFLSE